MTADERSILEELSLVAAERDRRAGLPALAEAVQLVKHYQQRRFSHTYADLLSSGRYAAAARFFLDDLYGPRDFSERDAQFARVVPALVRLFPKEIVATVRTLAQLHSLSEQLDTRMASLLLGGEIDSIAYTRAWQATPDAAARERQISLTLAVGSALDKLTRRPLLRHSLNLMRGPARAAGLGDLQQFLERGFDSFKSMRGAQDFLGTVATRERSLAASLFAARLEAGAPEAGPAGDSSALRALRLLP